MRLDYVPLIRMDFPDALPIDFVSGNLPCPALTRALESGGERGLYLNRGSSRRGSFNEDSNHRGFFIEDPGEEALFR